MIYCIDIDGTICNLTETQEYSKAEPFPEMVKKINRLYGEGHTIKIFTARGMGSGKNFKLLTEHQLNKWGIDYHELIMGKPAADVYVDDKGWTPAEFLDGKNKL